MKPGQRGRHQRPPRQGSCASSSGDMTLERLEQELARMEELGTRGRRGLKQFPDTPNAKSQVSDIVFASRRGDLPGQVAEADAAAGNGYKVMFTNAAGRPSWVEQTSGVRPSPCLADDDEEDLDDLEARRGVKHFSHFDQASRVFDGVMVDKCRGSSRGGRQSRQRPAKPQDSSPPEHVEDYKGLFESAAGTPSWSKRPTRAKGSVSDRLRHKTAMLSRRLMTRITKDWKVGNTEAMMITHQDINSYGKAARAFQRSRSQSCARSHMVSPSNTCNWTTVSPQSQSHARPHSRRR
eukprot:TRINITY_DN76288_c0_g1_i1.p1 TRINITY_DN76288_c0_g1~~TRINITY_DN76288_c0_g1_i1.p1  ORF type:complete len:294 (+),score=29.95 TRINITY_DN76288_c0_g1_i1:76-957(+)